MVKYPRLSAVLTCAGLLALAASPAGALSESTRQLADRTTSVLVAVDGELARLAASGAAELADRDLVDGDLGGVRRYTPAEVESWTREARLETTRARNAVNGDRRKLEEGRLDGGEGRFIQNCYQNLEGPIAKMWEAQLLFAGNRRGSVAWLLSEMRRMERIVAGSHPDAHSEQRRRIFVHLASEYSKIRDRVAAARKRWVVELHGFIEFARERSVLGDDEHARGAQRLQTLLMRQFSYRSISPNVSTFDYFVDMPGSPDRLITGYREYPWCQALPYPDLQSMRGSCNVFRMESAAKEGIAALRPPRDAAGAMRVFWRVPEDAPSRRLRLKSPDREVAAVRYRSGMKLALLIEGRGFDPASYVGAVVLRDLNEAGGRSVRVGRALLGEISRTDAGLASVAIDLDAALRQLGTRANRAVLEATVEAEINGKRLQVATQDAVHPVSQKLIVFLPGVPGSRIWVSTAPAAPSQEAWLRWSFGVLDTPPPASLLACDERGVPVNKSTQVDLLKAFVPFWPIPYASYIYQIEEREELLDAPGHPPVFRGDKRIPYYVVHPLPYDWRFPPTTTLEFLRGERRRRDRGSSTSAPYADPPSLEAVREDARGRLPFLDDKMVLVGHSTGGLLARKLLTDPGRAAMFDQAFFIDVPFFGAPKAYEVFLTGAMGIPPVLDTLMRGLSANLPILYFLAPTSRYPGDVLRWRHKHTERWRQIGRTHPSFHAVMDELVELAAVAGRPRELRWNRALAEAAEAFHAGLIENHLGEENCTVFYSQAKDTTSMVRVGPLGREFHASRWIAPVAGPGDETVTVVSQQGEFAGGRRLVRIPSNPLHVEASSEPFIWNTIRERIALRTDPAPLRIP